MSSAAGRAASSGVRRGIVWLSLVMLTVGVGIGSCVAETWRGLVVAPEHRCSPYDKKLDYPYPQSIEREIVRRLGAVYGPYTGTCFASTRRTDIEQMVATSEAHDSGLCARDRATRARFASDTAADTATRKAARTPPSGYRTATGAGSRPGLWKSGVPTISRLTGARLKSWSGCENVAMEPLVCHAEEGADQSLAVSSGDDALARYDDNGNGRITCREARRHGIAPVRRDHPAYRHMRDGDGDGVVCE